MPTGKKSTWSGKPRQTLGFPFRSLTRLDIPVNDCIMLADPDIEDWHLSRFVLPDGSVLTTVLGSYYGGRSDDGVVDFE